MKLLKYFLFISLIALFSSCSTYVRNPAQQNCSPSSTTNAGTHFDDYEKCKDL